tara:strand:- start:4037 stop:6130 length:2094 start_codon:yes stop_codon:yes gene_type:complete
MDRPFSAYKGEESYIFVSYAHEDDELVYPEIEWLQSQGFNIWYDEGISPGSTWREELAQAVKNCDLFLLFVTPRSTASDNCQKEVNFALDEGHPLLAVHLDRTELPDGLRLSLSDRQAILKHELSEREYRAKLIAGIGDYVARKGEVATLAPVPAASGNNSKTMLIGFALVALAILVVGVLLRPGPDSPTGTEVQTSEAAGEATVDPLARADRSIAVLPFEDMSAEQDQAFLGRGIAEELINGLTRLEGLRVASRTSSFYNAKQDLPITTMAERMKVRHILEGSIRKAGNRVRITMQLIDAESDTHLASQTYDRDLDDLFAVQDEIAKEVVKALKVELGFEPDQAIVNAGTENTEAFEAYRKAMAAVSIGTAASVIRAEQHARRAIELDPGYTWPYLGLFSTIGVANLYGIYTDQQVKELKQSLLTSWQNHHGDDDSELTRYTRQLFTADIDRNVLLQEESLRYLILQGRMGLRPYGDVLWSVGEYQLAREFLLYAAGEAEQRNANDEHSLGMLAVVLDDLKTASEHLQRCIAIEPDTFFCRFQQVRVLVALGDFDRARSHLQYMKSRLGGENLYYMFAAAILSGQAGLPGLLDDTDQFVPPFFRGTVFTAQCDIENALIEWKKSLQSGSFMIPNLRPHLTENSMLEGRQSPCPADEILARADVQAFLAKMGIDEEGHRIIRQRALSLAGALGIDAQ